MSSPPYTIPAGFRVDRTRPAGKYPLLRVFPGFTSLPPFRRYLGDLATHRAIARRSFVHVFDGRGYMYLAPREIPAEIRRAGFAMITSPDDEICIGRSYLARGGALSLYLDIIHEFLHILQRKAGRELWPGLKVAYVDRPTEIEGYAFSVAEARRLGVPDGYLRKYLDVPWVTRSEYRRLLRYLGVNPPRPRATKRA